MVCPHCSLPGLGTRQVQGRGPVRQGALQASIPVPPKGYRRDTQMDTLTQLEERSGSTT